MNFNVPVIPAWKHLTMNLTLKAKHNKTIPCSSNLLQLYITEDKCVISRLTLPNVTLNLTLEAYLKVNIITFITNHNLEVFPLLFLV